MQECRVEKEEHRDEKERDADRVFRCDGSVILVSVSGGRGKNDVHPLIVFHRVSCVVHRWVGGARARARAKCDVATSTYFHLSLRHNHPT